MSPLTSASRPIQVSLVDQADEPAQLGRVLDAVLRLAEDGGDQAAALAQLSQDVAVVALQLVAVQRLARLASRPAGMALAFTQHAAPARRPS
jgi:hypothetical protein